MAKIKPPKLEIETGVETYKSTEEGIGGRIKRIPEDFVVNEIPLGAQISEDGEHTHFTLKKTNWDTLRAIKQISSVLGVSQNRFGFAGTKDKKAVTTQRVSAWKVPIEKLQSLRIKDIELSDFSYSDVRINLGNLKGNRFTITIRNIDLGKKEIETRIEKISKELKSGFPNFYGIQRFGVTRPITHLVGKAILQNDFESAVMIYLSEQFDEEGEESTRARRILAEKKDFKEAVRIFPKHLGYENAMLNHLLKNPNDFKGALKKLPKNLSRMFVHAYQSYVFNRALSEYVDREIDVERLPLVGTEIQIDEISSKILEKEKIKQTDFEIKELPELSSKGEYRNCFSFAENFKIFKIEKDELNDKKNKVVLQFSLERGMYATVFLREFMKNEYWK